LWWEGRALPEQWFSVALLVFRNNEDNMKTLLLVVTAFVFVCIPASASCDEETISEVKGHGEIIIMLDGSIWKSLDRVTSSTWLTADDVLICDDDEIINTDEDGESVSAVRIR
jgi:hypothetical protein